jgi:hypothetical protein
MTALHKWLLVEAVEEEAVDAQAAVEEGEARRKTRRRPTGFGERARFGFPPFF